MTRVLLDTSGYSAFLRGHPEIKISVRQAEEIYVNPVVLGELRAGFLRGGRLRKNESELGVFLASPRVGVVDVDEETADRYAQILDSLWRAGTPIPTNDIWISASAMQHGLRLVTTDAHYKRVAQVLVDYFEAS